MATDDSWCKQSKHVAVLNNGPIYSVLLFCRFVIIIIIIIIIIITTTTTTTTEVEFLLGGNSPYTSTDKRNKNKYT
jgi:uncharacterized integral membrane protein